MISKVAIQIGIGITIIGSGAAGVTTYFAWNKQNLILQEFIVVTAETINSKNRSTDEPIQNEKKQYFCQWRKNGYKKEDQNCIIQKMKLDIDKTKTISFSKLHDAGILSVPTITDLGTKNHVFKLTITSHNEEITKSNSLINISSTKDGNKKYGSVKTIMRLSHKKEKKESQKDDIKTTAFIATMIPSSLQENIDINSTYKCTWKIQDPELKPCNIHKIEMNDDNIEPITNKNDFQVGGHYIINFTDDKDAMLVSELLNKKNSNLVIVYVEIKNKTTKEIGGFLVNYLLVGNIASTISNSEFILLK